MGKLSPKFFPSPIPLLDDPGGLINVYPLESGHLTPTSCSTLSHLTQFRPEQQWSSWSDCLWRGKNKTFLISGWVWCWQSLLHAQGDWWILFSSWRGSWCGCGWPQGGQHGEGVQLRASICDLHYWVPVLGRLAVIWFIRYCELQITSTTLTTSSSLLAVALDATGAAVTESGYIYEVYKDIEVQPSSYSHLYYTVNLDEKILLSGRLSGPSGNERHGPDHAEGEDGVLGAQWGRPNDGEYLLRSQIRNVSRFPLFGLCR